MNRRRLITPREITALCVLLAASAAVMWMFSAGRGAAAEIRVDGAAVKRVSLAEDAEFSIGWRPNVRFAVKNGAIAFTESDCPDKVCIQSGFLSKPGQSAACLPNRVSLRVSGEAGDADAVGR